MLWSRGSPLMRPDEAATLRGRLDRVADWQRCPLSISTPAHQSHWSPSPPRCSLILLAGQLTEGTSNQPPEKEPGGKTSLLAQFSPSGTATKPCQLTCSVIRLKALVSDKAAKKELSQLSSLPQATTLPISSSVPVTQPRESKS